MIELSGKHNTAKVFTDNIDSETISQIINLLNQDFVENCKIRIMPDTHAGAGCVIGFTADLGNRVIPNIVGVDIGCVDKETEYLTKNGWKKISEYNSEEIAVFDMKNKSTLFEYPINYIKAPTDKFYYFKTKYGIDQVLTKDHKCLVETGSHHRLKSRNKLYTISAEEIYNRHSSLKLGFRDNFICDIPNLQIKSKNWMTDEQIRVQIMVMADGHIQNNGDCVCQFMKQRKIDRSIKLLKEANIKYEIKDREREGLFAIVFTPPSIEKRISYFRDCSLEQLKVICDEVMNWDGREEDGVYSSVYKEDVDFVQFAFAVNGYRTSINYDDRNGKELYRCIVSKSKPRVQLAGTPKSKIYEVNSIDGYKYCFTTSTGFWIMRRNGCICITGNCGMLTVELGHIDIDLVNLDEIIHKNIPSGKLAHEGRVVKFDKLQELYCFRELKEIKHIERSIGTLGGGNHFIELDKDEDNNLYLVIHSGSRNLGKQVADYYQNLAIELRSGKEEYYLERDRIIKEYKEQGRKQEIQSAIKKLDKEFKASQPDYPRELCFLEGAWREKYLHDMNICQEYALLNRETMANIILKHLFKSELKDFNYFHTIHNYINFKDNIIRKGSISAYKDEKILIPINMRDGSLLCVGKGNPDWNYSAPHGAGRIMSRRKAKESVTMDEYQESMEGIYTTSVNESTLDESPMAYKPMQEIIDNIQDTVDIIKIIKPVYNFKAGE